MSFPLLSEGARRRARWAPTRAKRHGTSLGRVGQVGERHVVIGVDGGGTSTDALVADLSGTVLGSATGGGSNWEGVGLPAMAAEVARTIDTALAAAGRTRHDVVAAAYGLAGVDWPSDVEPVRQALTEAGLTWPAIVTNDSFVALRAGCSRPWGIVSSIGTGAVTAGVNRQGQSYRTMAVGWGEPSGAHSMVREALDAVAAAHHGVAPATTLADQFLAALDVATVDDLFEAVSRRRIRIGAHLAPLLDRAAAGGDRVALDLIDSLARRHAAMVVAVAARLHMAADEFELVTSGGVHRAGGRFVDTFTAAVIADCPGAQLAPLHASPAHGAVAMAIDLARTAGYQA